MTVTGEYTRNLNANNNKFKVTDKFAISETVKDVVLSAEFGDAVSPHVYAAEATIVPGIDGLELYPRIENRPGTTPSLKFLAGAKYAVGSTTLLGGLIYTNALDMYFGYGDTSATYGSLDTRIAGLYLNTGGTVYKRAYAKATTNLNEYDQRRHSSCICRTAPRLGRHLLRLAAPTLSALTPTRPRATSSETGAPTTSSSS